MSSLSNGSVIVIAIISKSTSTEKQKQPRSGRPNAMLLISSPTVAGFVVITGAVIFKFGLGRRNGGDEEDGANFNQRSNNQEHYMREVRERNRAWNHYEARSGGGDRHSGYGYMNTGGAPSTISGTNMYTNSRM